MLCFSACVYSSHFHSTYKQQAGILSLNEILHLGSTPEFSWSEVSMSWLLVVAAAMMLFSLFEAWLATLIIYAKVQTLKKIFKVPHNLVRSHIDYLMMTALVIGVYFLCMLLHIVLPKAVIVLLIVGVIWNPFGFFLQSIDPNIGKSDTLAGKIMTCVSFLPTTVGFGYPMCAVLGKLI